VNPPAGPCSATALRAARDVALAALSASSSADGYAAAIAVLAALPAREMLEIAATLGLLLGRPEDLLIPDDEWAALAEWGADP
jgi:hypothetical protein